MHLLSLKYVLRRTLYLHVLMVKLVVNNSDAFTSCTITTACLEKPDPMHDILE